MATQTDITIITMGIMVTDIKQVITIIAITAIPDLTTQQHIQRPTSSRIMVTGHITEHSQLIRLITTHVHAQP